MHGGVAICTNGAARNCALPRLGRRWQFGTLEYCGPEVFEGKSGYRTDVYALGVTLFELLSGEKPFEVVWGDMFDDSFDADASARYAQMSDIQLPANLARRHG